MKCPEQKIAEEICELHQLSISKLGLRYDKVVQSVFEKMRIFCEDSIPKGHTLILTMTAPIKLAGKTTQALEEKISSQTGRFEKKIFINHNKIALKLVKSTRKAPKFIGFVHNPTTSSKLLIDLSISYIKA